MIPVGQIELDAWRRTLLSEIRGIEAYFRGLGHEPRPVITDGFRELAEKMGLAHDRLERPLTTADDDCGGAQAKGEKK